MAHIYRIFNVATEHFYVGSSVNFKKRKWEHLNQLKKNEHHCAALQAAWFEFGPEAFEFEILEEVPDENALQVEDTYLAKWAGQDFCYNTSHTATQSPAATRAETRIKIGDTLRKMYGAGDYCPRVGKTHSDETKAKISASKIANPSKHWLGKERSEETKAKISAAQKGVPKAPRVYTQEGLERARENMKRHAAVQVVKGLESVLAKFPAEIQERYDFSNAVYTGALERITGVFCEQHGIFSQYSARFRKSAGCPQCGGEQRAVAKGAQMKDAWGNPEGRAKMIAARKK